MAPGPARAPADGPAVAPLDAGRVDADLAAFDPEAGGWPERLVFGHRRAVVVLAAAVTAGLGAIGAARFEVAADYQSMFPVHHPFVVTAQALRGDLRGLGNALEVVLESRQGEVYQPEFLAALRRLTDDLVLTPGVDRAWVRSLWMPGVRWTEVTEEGYRGGPVMPDDYDGSPAAIEALRRNVRRAGLEGKLVARDGRSSLIYLPLLDRDPATGRGLDYRALSTRLDALREALEGPAGQGRYALHLVGFARLAGELMAGTRRVVASFAVAAGLVTALLLLATRCLRSTALVVGCSAAAVAWQLGLMAALGLALDPFSVLVPFLIFALGVSHGTQKMNGVLQDVGRGATRLVAARRTFRRLFRAGLTALLTDLVGFAVLWLIDVPAVQRLALVACLGAAVLVFTNLILLPVLLSYAGVSRAAAARARAAAEAPAAGAAWRPLERLASPGGAAAVLGAACLLVGGAALIRQELQVGDLAPGAPELGAASRYNRDVAFLAAGYGLSSDRLAVVVRTGPEGCLAWRTLVEADRLGWALQQLPGVQGTSSLADAVRQITAGAFEGNPKWLTLSRDQSLLNAAAQQAVTRNPDLFNSDGSVMPVVADLADHRAATLDRVVDAAQAFARDHGREGRQFLLAAGSAGLQAATNQEVRQARWPMTLAVYAAVTLLCLLVLRSGRAVLVTVVPLAVTTFLCEALMAGLGIGITLSSLPVIALGVGIPDFALYLLAVQLAHQRAGLPLAEAWRRALRFTGRAVVLVSLTLAAGVVTWIASPLKLQADMGLLLAFMFLANMASALTLLPALSWLLLRGRGLPSAPHPS